MSKQNQPSSQIEPSFFEFDDPSGPKFTTERAPPLLTINSTEIEDTFAEAFPMTAARLIVTAESAGWARIAAQEATGYAASVIGCDAEAGIECELPPEETPDGRPGVSLLLFAFNREALEKAAINRVGQCVLTCATTACYNGLPVVKDKSIRIGGNLRFFGDGFQSSKKLDRRRFWRVPVMDGEFTCEDRFGTVKGVAGGNFLILGESQRAALEAAEAAAEAIRTVPGVILPFPGGVVRSGSKVGSRYKQLRASTNDAYCPTLRALVTSALPDGVQAVYEIVIDGLDLPAVEQAMRSGITAACRPGVVRITAGNYGGTLGPFHLHLHKLLGEA
ncbi:MAG TPA: formylmethanofuran--tetrahydromethanopterin N-formyltransferase [Pirellulales bacterium]|nr:formylmethanofuran--tetrahydromethanopterin N-formyltransferase [Pirellulales bacterium]